MRRRGRLLLLFVLFTYLTFFAGNALSARFLSLRVVFHLFSLATLGLWLLGLIRRRQGLPRSELDLSLLGWLVVAVAASLTGLCPRFSFERTWLHFTYVLGFYLLLELQNRGQEPLVLRALFLTAAVVCLAGLFEWLSWYLGLSFLRDTPRGWPAIGGWSDPIPPVLHRLNATLGGSTPLAAYLAVLVPPALGWMLTTKRPQTKWAMIAWLGVALVVEILTFSRGGILALGVSLPLTGLGWIASHPRWQTRLRRWFSRRRAWRYGSLLLVLLVVTAAAAFWLSHSFTGRRGSTAHRVTLWQVALETLERHPLLGAGPGNFGRALLQQNDPSLPRHQIRTAHNAFLNSAAEVGFLGLLAGASLLLALSRGFLAHWRRTTGARRIRLMTCGAALVGLGAQLTVDTFTAPANWLPILILVAHILRSPLRKRPRPRRRVWSSMAAFALLIVSTGWLGWNDVAQYHFERSVQLARQGDYRTAVQSAGKAQAMDAGLSLYAFQSGCVRGLQASAEESPSWAASAIEDYQTGLSFDPVWGKQTANMASLLWQLDEKTEAIAWMERTVGTDPRPFYILNLGVYQEAIGHEQKAWESYGKALASSPSWAESGFWNADPHRAAAWDQVVRMAERTVLAKDGEEGLLRLRTRLAWAEQDYDQLEDYSRSMIEASSQDADGYIWLARSLLRQNRASAALVVSERATSIAGRDARAWTIHGCARWQARGELGAIEELHRALFISPRATDAYRCLGEIHQEQGNLDAAIDAYRRSLSGRVVSQDVEMTLYGRLAAFEPLPGLTRIGLGKQKAAPWLELARLHEQADRCEDARAVYRALLAEDTYLQVARERLQALACYDKTEG